MTESPISTALPSPVALGGPPVVPAAPAPAAAQDFAGLLMALMPTAASPADGQPDLPAESGKKLPGTGNARLTANTTGGANLPDRQLEEFAVEIGIDRELARLLLEQTGAGSVSEPLLDGSDDPVRSRPKEEGAYDSMPLPLVLVMPAMLPPAATPPSPTGPALDGAEVQDEARSARLGDAGVASMGPANSGPAPQFVPAAFGVWRQPMESALSARPPDAGSGTPEHLAQALVAASAAPTTAPIVTMPTYAAVPPATPGTRGAAVVPDALLPATPVASSAAVVPDALLPATPVASSAAVVADAIRPATLVASSAAVVHTSSTVPAALPLAATVRPIAAPQVTVALADEDLLRWRALRPAALPEAASASRDQDSPLPLPAGSEGRVSRPTGQSPFSQSPAPRDVATPDPSAFNPRATQQSFASSLATTADQLLTAVLPTALPITPPVMQSPSFQPAQPPAATPDVPLRVPEALLTYAQRAEVFAHQVGQRLLQSINTQQWSVSLRVEPANLGPVDIALQVHGRDVAADISVVSPTVQSLLEQGMPTLRQSLETAGLQLSALNFTAAGTSYGSQNANSNAPGRQQERPTVRPGALRVISKTDSRLLGGNSGPADASGRDIDLFV